MPKYLQVPYDFTVQNARQVITGPKGYTSIQDAFVKEVRSFGYDQGCEVYDCRSGLPSDFFVDIGGRVFETGIDAFEYMRSLDYREDGNSPFHFCHGQVGFVIYGRAVHEYLEERLYCALRATMRSYFKQYRDVPLPEWNGPDNKTWYDSVLQNELEENGLKLAVCFVYEAE